MTIAAARDDASPAAPTRPVGEFQRVPLAELHESPLNPRKYFDPLKLQELAASVRASGILTPLLARPRAAGGFEVAAGHRRLKAGRMAQVIDAPVVVREMDDAEFLDVLVVENGQREDLHPLEEAQGYRSLMEGLGYDVAVIGRRIGRSTDYVYDRLRLLQLIPAAQKLFLQNRFTLGHAVLLARLSPEWQERAILADQDGYGRDHRSGLFRIEHGHSFEFDDSASDDDPYAGLKPCSVKEFEYWIDTNVRFDTEAADVGDLFGETADALIAAEESELKVIHITRLYVVPDPARDAAQRTFTTRAWERADGREGSKECEHAVLGVVVVGPGRGESFAVCIAKDKCTVHYAARIREKAKREKAAARNGGSKAAAGERAAERREEQKWEVERKKRELEQKRWRKAAPAIIEAAATAVRSASVLLLGDFLVEEARPSKVAARLVERGASAEDLLRHLVFAKVERDLHRDWGDLRERIKLAKYFGVDAAKILNELAPIEAAPPPPSAKARAPKKRAKAATG